VSMSDETIDEFDDDSEAIKHLEGAGFVMTRGFCWRKPSPDYKPTAQDNRALDYLWIEWDFGGLVDDERTAT
jgi:hypothetical protein